jgi:glycosyltransferase involved in cell wall biosynthesis
MITLNNGATIEKALASVAGWVDEVVVVDSESTDTTPEIAKRYGQLSSVYDDEPEEKYRHAQDLCTSAGTLHRC